MRIEIRSALLLCLLSWIPAALSQNSGGPPEDQDASGDDWEISGSGSGDEDAVTDDFKPTDLAMLPVTNTTRTAWVTDAPVKVPEKAATQLSTTVIPHADVQTADPITQSPILQTTKISQTHPPPTTVLSFIHVEKVLDQTTTVSHTDDVMTTTPPEEKLNVVPVITEEPSTTTTAATTTAATTTAATTTAATSTVATTYPEDTTVEETTVLEYEDEVTFGFDLSDLSTDAPDTETTSLPLTTSPGEAADTEASGDHVGATTVQDSTEESTIEQNVLPGVNQEKDLLNNDDGDFGFDTDNEIRPKTRAKLTESEVALGTSSEDGSLLERTEVLAGVIAGGLVGLAFAIMLVALMVYRMKKKDEGSYSLDEHKPPNGGYQRPVAQEEFLA